MTDKTTVQVTYTLQGSLDQGYRIDRTENAALSVHERLACLFSDVRTLHKALVGASTAGPHEAELDANTVILQLVARTLQHGADVARVELDDRDELCRFVH